MPGLGSESGPYFHSVLVLGPDVTSAPQHRASLLVSKKKKDEDGPHLSSPPQSQDLGGINNKE